MGQNDKHVTKNIILCDDKKYRWVYEVNLFKDLSVLGIILKIFGGIILFGILMCFISELFGSHNYMEVLKTGGIMFAIMFGLALIGYFVYAMIMGGKYCVIFTMDYEKITHEQQPKQVKKANVVADLLTFAGALSGNPTVVGVGMSSSNAIMHTSFLEIKKITSLKKKNTIKLDSPMNHNRVFCEKEDFDFVWDYIKSHCKDAKIIIK